MSRVQTLVLNLRRDSPTECWGFSLVGGSDQNTPIIVTKVSGNSPASRTLRRGDIITKIGNYDSRDIRHADAQQLFQNAGTSINVVVQRNPHVNNPEYSYNSSAASSLTTSPSLSPRIHNQTNNFLPVTTEGYFKEIFPSSRQNQKLQEEDIENVLNQPYRTTPLVLPGAKVKRDAGPTESYLRHHPNPAVRSSSHHHYLDPQQILKQRIVHKQFNSPIGMYSDANIVDTIKHQAGLSTKKFDPMLSETYKALQEEKFGDNTVQEVRVPVQPKVFTPNKLIPGKKPSTSHPQQYANSMGNDPEVIQQSGSFKRLMWHVLANDAH